LKGTVPGQNGDWFQGVSRYKREMTAFAARDVLPPRHGRTQLSECI
jgi:hypothetical protein